MWAAATRLYDEAHQERAQYGLKWMRWKQAVVQGQVLQ
jgi:hypothetical protein